MVAVAVLLQLLISTGALYDTARLLTPAEDCHPPKVRPWQSRAAHVTAVGNHDGELCAERSGVGRRVLQPWATTATGQLAWWITVWATGPVRRPSGVSRIRRPTTSRLAPGEAYTRRVPAFPSVTVSETSASGNLSRQGWARGRSTRTRHALSPHAPGPPRRRTRSPRRTDRRDRDRGRPRGTACASTRCPRDPAGARPPLPHLRGRGPDRDPAPRGRRAPWHRGRTVAVTVPGGPAPGHGGRRASSVEPGAEIPWTVS